MQDFEVPFYKKSLKVRYSKKGLLEMSFQNKSGVSKKPGTPFEKRLSKELKLYFSGEQSHLDLPIDWSGLEGTDFQKQV